MTAAVGVLFICWIVLVLFITKLVRTCIEIREGHRSLREREDDDNEIHQ